MKKKLLKSEPIAIAYFGAFAPDRPDYKTPASSTAGNLFQINFLSALRRSNLPTPEVYSYLPMPSFPKHKCLLYRGGRDRLADGTSMKFLPFLNLGPLKILTLGIASFLQTLAWSWRHRKADRRIVISYNLNAPPAWPLWLACKIGKTEFVPFIGDIYVPGEVIADSWLRRREFDAQKWIIPKVDGLLVANKAIVEDFAKGRDSLLIEGGVPESFLRRFETVVEKEKHAFHIVFAGQLSQLNGVELLLDAIAKVPSKDVRFTIAGSGPLHDKVKKAAMTDNRISFAGLVPHRDLLEIYRRADLVLSLRRTDNLTHRYVFPSKVVECLATGVPLLTTCTGHAEEEFGRFAILLQEETPDALAAKIEEVAGWTEERRNNLGLEAQAYVRQNRTWESNIVRLEAYLETSRRAA
jgi:glycosyltransferase involved in cell wall biosynthesis